jgi:hypothetical protein
LKPCTSISSPFFLACCFRCCFLPRPPAMSSVEGSFDPSDPCAGEEFVKKVEIPQGLLLAPSVFLSDGALALGSQSAAFRRDTKTVEFDNLFGTPALERWSEAQDRLLEELFGFSGASAPPLRSRRCIIGSGNTPLLVP